MEQGNNALQSRWIYHPDLFDLIKTELKRS